MAVMLSTYLNFNVFWSIVCSLHDFLTYRRQSKNVVMTNGYPSDLRTTCCLGFRHIKPFKDLKHIRLTYIELLYYMGNGRKVQQLIREYSQY